MAPESGSSSPAIILSSVVLPAPFGPAQADALAVGDLPGDVVEQDAVAEGLGESSRAGSCRWLRQRPARGRRGPTRAQRTDTRCRRGPPWAVGALAVRRAPLCGAENLELYQRQSLGHGSVACGAA